VSPETPAGAEATFSAVDAIKNGRPDACLTVLTPTDLAHAWRKHGTIDQVISWHPSQSVRSIANNIRRVDLFDVAIHFNTGWKTSVGVWMAGIPLRVGMRGGIRSWFFNQHPVDPIGPLDPEGLSLHIAQSVGANVNELLLERAYFTHNARKLEHEHAAH
jgi:ADP-heptose:LPS heptosyltransferase